LSIYLETGLVRLKCDQFNVDDGWCQLRVNSERHWTAPSDLWYIVLRPSNGRLH